jgi:hypothetical protein
MAFAPPSAWLLRWSNLAELEAAGVSTSKLYPLPLRWTVRSRCSAVHRVAILEPYCPAANLPSASSLLRRLFGAFEPVLSNAISREAPPPRFTRVSQQHRTAMDYSYFGGPQQPYNHFIGMQHAFANSGLDADTTQSIVSRARRPEAPATALLIRSTRNLSMPSCIQPRTMPLASTTVCRRRSRARRTTQQQTHPCLSAA